MFDHKSVSLQCGAGTSFFQNCHITEKNGPLDSKHTDDDGEAIELMVDTEVRDAYM